MATLRTIRLRIKGTKNIKQITRAMEAVSAVKMRKSQGVALAARPYATAALDILKNLTRSDLVKIHPLVEPREVHQVLLVVVTSDKGLAGSFNTNVLKKAEQFMRDNTTSASGHSSSTEEEKKIFTIATVGKKASEYFSRRGRTPILALTGFGDYADIAEVKPIFEAVTEAFTNKKADEVYIVYTNFLSAMKQEVVVRKLLPFSEQGLREMVEGIVPVKGRFSELHLSSSSSKEEEASPSVREGAGGSGSEYLFEPSPKEIFDSLLPSLLEIELYHAILEANASEHSSRMVAMRSATDNAGDLIKSYTVSLNKARQSAINKELAEISGGAEALST